MKKIFVLSVVLLLLGGIATLLAFKKFENKGSLSNDVYLVVPKGASFRQVAFLLGQENVIDSPFLFRVMARVKGLDKNIKAGEYYFPPHISMQEVLQKIATGDVFYRKITFAEGITNAEIARLLLASDMLEGELELAESEGVYLPETYKFEYGASRQSILNHARSAMDKVLDQAWNNRDESVPVKNKYELLILASIIEKETSLPEERALVASVFANRLKIGMRLQTDPTVIYALTLGKSDLGRSLTRKDLQIDSPYNTYQNLGLPPTPICNPGAESIWAAAHPADPDFIYFVADGNGGHNFARTLGEHNRNVKNWVKKISK